MKTAKNTHKDRFSFTLIVISLEPFLCWWRRFARVILYAMWEHTGLIADQSVKGPPMLHKSISETLNNQA